MSSRKPVELSPYRIFTKAEWAKLRADAPMTLTEAELEQLGGLTERLSMEEVIEVYLPLSRLLYFYVEAAQSLHAATGAFLNQTDGKLPFIIGLAGSVAVGKSTTARVLQALLARWNNHRQVELLPTDGFLHPNAILEERGLMEKKGFPESYDLPRLLRFLGRHQGGPA